MREPWRNTYAHLHGALGWQVVRARHSRLDIVRFLETKPLDGLQTMIEKEINSPMASSCGRLFDAVAAAIGVCRERVSHEGQAAIELESLATAEFYQHAQTGYPYDFNHADEGLKNLGWRPLWEALLLDISKGVAPATIAARFHQGLIQAVAKAAQLLSRDFNIDTVVLGGGVFQNRLLLEGVSMALGESGVRVLSPEQVPVNDGGLALGQVAIAAARQVQSDSPFRGLASK